jgi:tripartite-type tricarboxylate transporter receptor subunit TctC
MLCCNTKAISQLPLKAIMKKFSTLVTACLLSIATFAEPLEIRCTTGVGPTFGLSPAMMKVFEHANSTQTKYKFVPEFKPGANGLISIKALDAHPESSIVGVGPHFLKHTVSNKLKKEDYKPVEHAGYDICTGVITNIGETAKGLDSLEAYRGKTVNVGTVSPASPAYLTAVELSKKYGFIPKFVSFNSDDDGFQSIVGNHGINFAFGPPKKFRMFKDQNPNLQLLAVHCPTRMQDAPDIKTLAEHRIKLPNIFNLYMAKSAMPAERREEIGKILARSQIETGMFKAYPHLMPPTNEGWQLTRLIEQEQFVRNAN